MRNVNLIPQVRRELKARKARTVKWSLAVAAYFLTLGAAYMTLDRYATDDSRALASQSKRASMSLSSSHKLVQAMGQELATTTKKLLTVQEIGGQPDWGQLLAVLGRSTSDSVALNFCRMDRVPDAGGADAKSALVGGDSPTVLELGGVAKVQADVSAYVLRLEKLGLFEKVRLVKTSRETYQGQEAVGFRLECLLQGQTPPVRAGSGQIAQAKGTGT